MSACQGLKKSCSTVEVHADGEVIRGVAHEDIGGGFKHFVFSPLIGEMIQFDYFSTGLKPPTRDA